MIELTASQEAAAPTEFIFDQARRFRNFANQARQNGARVRRREPDPESGRGLRWEVAISFQGLQREFTLELLERRPPDLLRFGIESPSVEGEFRVDFTALGPGRCRVDVALALRPRTLRARLVMQGLRLSQGRMLRGLQRRLAAAVERAETAYAEGQRQD
ncbi:SRPBCC family protein [Alkalilacustris brevis]|uniref:SRPBCC family protein n=1 Tax=Alkalilacustris brevis TaxID=2026338 RepID=UPI00138FFFE0|nr:SRPBCC family protein [Alkalilacustris brevis]